MNTECDYDNSNMNSPDVYTDLDICYLLGAYLGDGHCYYVRSSYQFTLTTEDRDFCEECSKICLEEFGNGGTISQVQNHFKLVVCSKELCDFILSAMCSNSDFYSASAKEKKSILPPFATINSKMHFLSGLMDSDGWIREAANGKYLKYEIGFKNTSQLSPSIYEMMQSIGMKCGKIVNKLVDGTPTWLWTITPSDFVKHCRFRIQRKNKLLNDYVQSRNNTTKRSNNIIIRFTDIENAVIKEKSKLYGMTVSDIIREASLSYSPKTEPNFEHIFKQFNSATDQEKDSLTNIVFDYYRRTGYPHRKLSSAELQREMLNVASSSDILLEDDHLQINSNGISIGNYFHPHMMEVKCNRYMSPMSLYNNDELFKKAIRRVIDMGKIPAPYNVRRILRTRDGVKSVVNFKPVVARYIYDTYAKPNSRVLDPCAGYGGRLSGAIAANKGLTYTGIDPDGRTIVGNTKLGSFYASQFDIDGTKEWNFDFRLIMGCAEDIMKNLEEKYSLIFTSPPYFDVEQYSNDPTQSYIRHNTYEKWRESFLRVIVKESHRLLENDGYLVINVKNYKDMAIADDLILMSIANGFALHKTYQMRLSNSEYNRKKETWHTEPIFILTKASN